MNPGTDADVNDSEGIGTVIGTTLIFPVYWVEGDVFVASALLAGVGFGACVRDSDCAVEVEFEDIFVELPQAKTVKL